MRNHLWKIVLIAVGVVLIAGGLYSFLKSKQISKTEDGPTDKTSISLYFGNTVLNPDYNPCGEVFAVTRSIPRTDDRVKVAMTLLFTGPTKEEKIQGYSSWFSEETRALLKSIEVKNGVVYVNFSDIDKLIPNASTSCGSASFFGEVGATIKQFPEVKEVIFAINGTPSVFYDWMQQGCEEGESRCDETPFKN